MKRILLILLLTLTAATPVFAAPTENGYILDKATMDKYAKNGIYYYNPTSGSTNCIPGDSAGKQITGVGYERVKQAVEIYGPAAMQAQRIFGVPWEVLIAQMQWESGTGTSNLAVATNNWLGIRGEGDAGTYQTATNGNFAKYSGVEMSINAWAGKKVLRNGLYDTAFQYLQPDNYDLHQYLSTVIPTYAPASDGNDPVGYVANVESLIEKVIAPAAKANGFPTSAELAKQENIQPGGQYPIGTEIPDDIDVAATCAAFNGDINETALLLSWPDRSHDSTDPKPEYREALKTTGISKLGDLCSMAGRSCDAFVATVMRASGADPDFYCCGAQDVLDYLVEQTKAGKYEEIENIGSADNLQGGDIRSKPSHVEMYVVEDGVGKIASASHGAHDGYCTGARTGDRGRAYYPDSAYRIFRRIK